MRTRTRGWDERSRLPVVDFLDRVELRFDGGSIGFEGLGGSERLEHDRGLYELVIVRVSDDDGGARSMPLAGPCAGGGTRLYISGQPACTFPARLSNPRVVEVFEDSFTMTLLDDVGVARMKGRMEKLSRQDYENVLQICEGRENTLDWNPLGVYLQTGGQGGLDSPNATFTPMDVAVMCHEYRVHPRSLFTSIYLLEKWGETS